MLKRGIAWLLLALLLAGGCAAPAPVKEDTRQRVPSPTSALPEDGPVSLTMPGASSAGISLQFTEVRSSGDL